MQKLLLASSSPRRKELLTYLGIPFEVQKPDCEERRLPGELPEVYVRRNSEEKWLAVAQPGSADRIVLGADTIVVHGAQVLEKPVDRADALRMLTLLSNSTHQVITGFTVGTMKNKMTTLVTTDVCFKELRDAEISEYLETDEPWDKAGAYAAQGIGSKFIQSVHGSYTNVIGLPLAEVSICLQKFF